MQVIPLQAKKCLFQSLQITQQVAIIGVLENHCLSLIFSLLQPHLLYKLKLTSLTRIL